MDFKFALTGEKSNNPSEDIQETNHDDVDVDNHQVDQVLVDDEDSKTNTVKETSQSNHTKPQTGRGRGGRGRGSGGRGSSGRGSGGRGSGGRGSSGRGSGGRGSGGRGKPRVQRTEEYWETFRKAQDILFKECILTDDDLEQASVNAQYMTDYRGETKWIKIKNEESDTIKTGVDDPEMQFQKSKLLMSKSFRKKLEEYYHDKAPNMYVKIFQSYKNNDICIKLVPRTY